MSTISVKYCDIPLYLHAGAFYRNLSPDEPTEVIEIPADCFAPDEDITMTTSFFLPDNKLNEFCQLLRVTLFWMLDEVPLGLMRFCLNYPTQVWREVLESLPEGSATTECLKLLFRALKDGNYMFINNNRWEVVMLSAKHLNRNDAQVMFAVARTGRLDILKHFHEQGFDWGGRHTCDLIANAGSIDCLRYAHENGCRWDWAVFEVAAYYGHLRMMQYAHEQGLEWHHLVCKRAASGGHLDCLQYAHENGCPWDSMAVHAAAAKGHADCLRYLLHHDCELSGNVLSTACKGGHVRCVQVLREYNVAWDSEACCCAAKLSDVACLQYLHENGCPWDMWTCYQTAAAGRLSTLRYTLEHDCPHNNRRVMQYAARSGSLECLQYLVEECNFPLDEEVFKLALLRGNFLCVQYLLEQRCPYLDATFTDTLALKKTAGLVFVKSNPDFVRCLEYVVAHGWTLHKEFVDYLVEHDLENCKVVLKSQGWSTTRTSSCIMC